MKISTKPALVAALGGAVILASLAVRPRESAAGPTSLAGPDGGPPLERFDVQPFADEQTPLPDGAAWKPVGPVSLTDPLPSSCRAYRLREWVKIHCASFSTSAIAQLGGSREGVAMFLVPSRFGGVPEGGELIFPVRRGNRRVFEWSTFGDSYEGPGSPEVAFMISESWLPGEAAPTIIMR
ncbi:MAG: hypothetical protein QM820_45230 [Minicystis sp.]